MLGRDFEYEVWSRSVFELARNPIGYFGKMNSTLGSVVPLAMLHHKNTNHIAAKVDGDLMVKLHFVLDWLGGDICVTCWQIHVRTLTNLFINLDLTWVNCDQTWARSKVYVSILWISENERMWLSRHTRKIIQNSRLVEYHYYDYECFITIL